MSSSSSLKKKKKKKKKLSLRDEGESKRVSSREEKNNNIKKTIERKSVSLQDRLVVLSSSSCCLFIGWKESRKEDKKFLSSFRFTNLSPLNISSRSIIRFQTKVKPATNLPLFSDAISIIIRSGFRMNEEFTFS